MSVKFVRPIQFICLFIVIVSFTIFGCSGRPDKSGASSEITGRYAGDFPCADCSGLKIDLTLNPDSTYILKRTYIAAPNGDTTFVRKGVWGTRKGNKYNPGATLCILNPGDSIRFQLFKVVPPDTLLQLDRKGRKINSPFNASLVRKNGQ